MALNLTTRPVTQGRPVLIVRRFIHAVPVSCKYLAVGEVVVLLTVRKDAVKIKYDRVRGFQQSVELKVSYLFSHGPGTEPFL